MIGTTAEQGTHLPLTESEGTHEVALLNLAVRRYLELDPNYGFSFNGVPGVIVDGPDDDDLFTFESRATGQRDQVPASALCRHLL